MKKMLIFSVSINGKKSCSHFGKNPKQSRSKFNQKVWDLYTKNINFIKEYKTKMEHMENILCS